MKKNFSIKPYRLKVTKPWGYELILTPESSKVTGKILHLDDGKRFSLQYHDLKTETLTLISGKALIFLEDKNGEIRKIKMEKMKGYFIIPFQKHRCQGVENCLILEASTPEKGNTVRLDDDYSRGTETETSRKNRSEGKIYLG